MTDRQPRPATAEDVREQALAAAQAASGKKASDVAILDVSQVAVYTDFFVICHGNNDRQVRTIVEAVEERLRDGYGLRPLRHEGRQQARWVLVDYGDFFVHVFDAETREFYDLERLWADAVRVPFEAERAPGAAGPGERGEPGAAGASG